MSMAELVIQYFLSKDSSQKLISRENILVFNYMDSNFFTSIEFVEMISHFEENFSITFESEHFKRADFLVIGGLIDIINMLTKGK